MLAPHRLPAPVASQPKETDADPWVEASSSDVDSTSSELTESSEPSEPFDSSSSAGVSSLFRFLRLRCSRLTVNPS